MKKRIILSVALAAVTGPALAGGYIPVGVTAPARITGLVAQTVKAEVQETRIRQTPWDDIAASLKGCVAEGARQPAPVGRTNLEFNSLTCAGRPSVHIRAVAVSPTDDKVGFAGDVDKQTPLNLVFLESAELK